MSPLDDVDLEGHGVDLDPQPRGGLVDEVDGLVRQLAAGDVSGGEHRGRDERGVLDPDAVVDLVALLQPAQDRDGVLDGGLTDEDLLEAALERGVLLDVLAVLVEGGGADHAELTSGEHRLDHVAGVDRALGGAGADDGVQLVDERDDLAAAVGDLLQHRLEAVLELASVLGAGDHRADVQRDEPLVAEALGDVALHDPARQTLGDRGLADAGVTDQHRVVLGAAGQDLDDPSDLLVAADDRVEPTAAGFLGEVTPVPLERLVLVLGVLARHSMGAPHGLEGVEDRVLGHARRSGAGHRPRRRPRSWRGGCAPSRGSRRRGRCAAASAASSTRYASGESWACWAAP